MQPLDTGFEKLILVCLNERTDGRACCLHRGSAEIHARLKQWVKDHGLSRRVRVSKSGCLDQCARGVTVVVLPDFCWYGGVTLEDVEGIVGRHLAGMLPSEPNPNEERSER
jgi:(2Fe-2S) ferredoxin